MKSIEPRLKIGYLDMMNGIFCSEFLVMASQLKPFTPIVMKKGPTVTIVKSESNIFGGFAENSWKSK